MYFISLEDFINRINTRGTSDLRMTIVNDKQIVIHYLLDVKLTLIESQQASLKFQYELAFGAGFMLKVLHTLLSGIRSKKFTLNTSQKCIWLHLDQFGAYKRALAGKHIADAHFENNQLALQLIEAK